VPRDTPAAAATSFTLAGIRGSFAEIAET
jgi:hypothetical protein